MAEGGAGHAIEDDRFPATSRRHTGDDDAACMGTAVPGFRSVDHLAGNRAPEEAQGTKRVWRV